MAMAENSQLAAINALTEEEQKLRHKESDGTASDADRRRVAQIEVELDQCWDLLRQRRARREFDLDPDFASERSEATVEDYES
jgi:hypothetical protein